MKVQVVLLVSTLSLVACGKANDLPALKVEGEGIAKSYQARFEDLARRADSILQRGNAIGVTTPDAANASRLFAGAKVKLSGPPQGACPPKSQDPTPCDVRGDAAKAPAEIADIVQSKEPPLTPEARRLKLRRYIDDKTREWRESYIEINAAFDAVESWIALAEARAQQVSRNDRTPPPVPPPPANPDMVPLPTGQGAGGTAPPPTR